MNGLLTASLQEINSKENIKAGNYSTLLMRSFCIGNVLSIVKIPFYETPTPIVFRKEEDYILSDSICVKLIIGIIHIVIKHLYGSLDYTL